MATKAQSEALTQQWRQRIDSWQASGQSQSEYCRANELSYHRFCYWQRKFRDQEGKSTSGGFVAVSRQPAPVSDGLSIILPRGLVLQGIAPDNLPVVYQLLSHLS